jgi:hypothetical protein
MSVKAAINTQLERGALGFLIGTLGLLCLAMVLMVTGGAGTARAGEYPANLCSAADRSASGIDRKETNSEIIAYRDRCSSGGAIEMRVIPRSGGRSGSGAGAKVMWDLPPGVSMSGLTFTGDLKDHQFWVPRLTVSGSGKHQYRPTTNPVPGSRTYRFDSSLSQGVGFQALPDTGYRRVTLKLSCNPVKIGMEHCSRSDVDSRAIVKNIQMTLRDSVAPTLRLREDGDVQDAPFPELNYGQGIDARLDYSDSGSGLKHRKILVNGKQLSNRDSYLDYQCSMSPVNSKVATTISPCPNNPEREDNVWLDTRNDRLFQEGSNDVEVWVTDHSGNVRYTKRELVVLPIPVEIDRAGSVFEGGDTPVVKGDIGGESANSGVQGPIEALDARSKQWVEVGSFTSGRGGKFKTKLPGLRRVTPSKVASTKTKKPRKGGKAKRGKLSTYKIRARVTAAPNARTGAISKVKEVKVKTVR